MKGKKNWFRNKRYGWGWYPAAWQGWLVILIYGIVLTAGIAVFEHRLPMHHGKGHILGYLLFVGFISAILILIAWRKGEPPGWHWGD